ncbi:flavodoxin [Lachnoanaerobaculum gingivalis]|uniref:Flavodoxin n=1 Tax=Lachnoanaerobaculum gingivalis TaxID=2490855 RepID=A0A3P3R081_9FIRM|nr:flavodoxin [Lachnoanaerobaculum gingivalis]RRJ26794.1 flavodoxin [Lachnoanaerobaculum gingivalis]WHE86483.1 flavodoxin [Lachnoanaerobaculum gingivalis]
MHHLIVYYSYSGITRRLAEDIALITDGDLRELKPQKPYSFSYNTAVKEVREEIEKGYCPTLIQGVEDIENVEVIFIGSPNWLKTFAPPVLSFLRKVDLSGKTIIPFCTHGGGGFGRMIEDYKKECKNSIIKDGIALKGDYSFDELQTWLKNNV